ncbi:hypothetical protein Cgig2_032195 [Carnegiea gigantea]|uniref:Uncharacterized protein n=1 Tax=Carnegiea gigantea TaxID=171969 RepID=A0A9Q1K4K3_9CARY|nr:hypothetical protein Cgig2_032195 [Carnegiea gigantea]
MAFMNPGLLLKQYHPKSPVSLGALWTICTRLNARAVQRESETVVESRVINRYTFSGRRVHIHIRLRDYKGVPRRQEVLLLDGREQPFLLSTDFPGVVGPSWDEELVDAPFEDECLGDLSEEEEDDPPESAIVISHGYRTSTSRLRILGVEEYSQLDDEGVPGSKRGIA